MTKTLDGFYVSFSGESDKPIRNVYALNKDGATASTQVLGAGPAPYQTFYGLRGMAFGPDGNFYVAQGKASDPNVASVIFQFSGAPAKRRRDPEVPGAVRDECLFSGTFAPLPAGV